MTRWRLTLAALVLLFVGVPVATPLLELLGQKDSWLVWLELTRLGGLAANTLLLVGGTLLLVMPFGVLGAILLYRTDLPWGGGLRLLVVLTLFIPLPLLTSAWQAALGTTGWLPQTARWLLGGDTAGYLAVVPWPRGLGPAIGVHALAALPWVILIVGQGLCWVERELEEDGLLRVPAWLVVWHVTLPRARLALFTAAVWVVLQTATEITVTDMMEVRTFAEEILYQFVGGDERGLAQAVAVALPFVVLAGALVVGTILRREEAMPPLGTQMRPPVCFPLGRSRKAIMAAVLVSVILLLGVPVVSLVWKAGLGGNPEAWSAAVAREYLVRVGQVHGLMIGNSLLQAGIAGALAAGLALLGCWLASESRWLRLLLLVLMAGVWAMPGPAIGVGLKEVIARLVDGEEWVFGMFGTVGPGPVETYLFRRPFTLPFGTGPIRLDLPVLWSSLVRFFPCAVAILWPVVRLLPAELRDLARVDGARPFQEFRLIVWPLAAPAALRAGLAVAVLALGEIGAGKLVEVPGSRTFAHEIFMQMHTGVSNNLAALCLVLLLLVAVGGILVACTGQPRPRNPHTPATEW